MAMLARRATLASRGRLPVNFHRQGSGECASSGFHEKSLYDSCLGVPTFEVAVVVVERSAGAIDVAFRIGRYPTLLSRYAFAIARWIVMDSDDSAVRSALHRRHAW